jgi:WD40 repeat protein
MLTLVCSAASIILSSATVMQVDKVTEFGDHKTMIKALRFSPKDAHLATSEYGAHEVRLWNYESHKLVAKVATRDEVFDIVFSPSGDKIAIGLGLKGIMVWNYKTDESHVYETPGFVVRICYSHDGRLLAASLMGGIAIWDTGDGTKGMILSTNDAKLNGPILFMNNSKKLVCGYEHGIIQMWNCEERAQIGKIEAHKLGLSSLIRLTDELIVSGGYDGKVVISDIRNLSVTKEITVFDKVTGLVRIDDNTVGVTTREGNVKIVSVRDGATKQVPLRWPIYCTDISRDSKVMAIGHGDYDGPRDSEANLGRIRLIAVK